MTQETRLIDGADTTRSLIEKLNKVKYTEIQGNFQDGFNAAIEYAIREITTMGDASTRKDGWKPSDCGFKDISNWSEISGVEIEQLAVSRIATWLYQQYDKEYDAKNVPVDTWQTQAREIWELVRHYPRPKPVSGSVSLRKCAAVIAIMDCDILEVDAIRYAKAVLDNLKSQGVEVQYVD